MYVLTYKIRFTYWKTEEKKIFFERNVPNIKTYGNHNIRTMTGDFGTTNLHTVSSRRTRNGFLNNL